MAVRRSVERRRETPAEGTQMCFTSSGLYTLGHSRTQHLPCTDQTWTWVGSIHGLGWVGLNFDGHIMGWLGINGLNCNDSTHVHIVAIVNKSVTA